MNLEEFVNNFAEQFDDTDPSEIQANTAFHDLEEWSSAKTIYGKSLTGSELRSCVTVEDLFNLLSSK